MASSILCQVDQITGAALPAVQIEQWNRKGITAVELLFSEVVRDAQAAESALSSAIDDFRAANPLLPVAAFGITCELLTLEQYGAVFGRLLKACAARGVQHLNLAVAGPSYLMRGAESMDEHCQRVIRSEPPASAGTDLQHRLGASSHLSYAEHAHLVYTALREARPSIEASGVMVNLEAAANGLFTSPLAMREVIDAINSWAIGACVDLPAVAAFSRPADWIEVLAMRMRVLRVKQNEESTPDFEGVIVRRA